jgi:hypothetical protein
MHRIKAAGVKRKISAKQNSVIRIVLTGSHNRMNEIEKSGKLNAAEHELAKMKTGYEKQLAEAKNAYQREIDAAIARTEAAEKKCAAQRETINRLDRKVNPPQSR